MKKFIAGALALTMIAGMACMPASAEVYDEITTDVMTTDGEQFNAATTAEAFLKSAVDKKGVNIYDGTSKTGFKVNGRTYYTGATFTDINSSVSFNTKNIKKLSFNVGHIDNTDWYPRKLTILFDGEEYKTYNLTPNMDLMNIRLDLTNVDKLTIKLPDYLSANYALVDMTVDGVKTKKGYTSPNYKSTDALLKGLYNTKDLAIYDSTKKLGFKMNGRTYYYGIEGTGEAAFSLNTDNISSLSFDLGHVDGSEKGSCEYNVYYDDELRDTIKCTFNMPIKTVSYNDLKDVHNLRIVRNTYSGTKYGMGNIKFNSVKAPKSYTVPTYTDTLDFMDHVYNTNAIEVYDGSKKLGFNMSGKNYKQGIVMEGEGHLAFNTENIGTLSFTLGMVDTDKSTIFPTDYKIYFDDVEKESIELKKGDKPVTKTYNVSGVKNVYISRNYSSINIALANISISKNAPKATVMKGDTNQDKQINVADIAVIASHIKGIKALTGNGLTAADVNGDKQINVGDIAMIASHIKGIKALK